MAVLTDILSIQATASLRSGDASAHRLRRVVICSVRSRPAGEEHNFVKSKFLVKVKFELECCYWSALIHRHIEEVVDLLKAWGLPELEPLFASESLGT